ncbi:MAG TPA: serine hydrolase [Candidatus Krumholzibacteria bacterium]|nr:serine hydrolase [Candidatus Krumholzibacteria bacterium]HPD73227.1 serine hydrolase [Candidatus Krumholzibacteria bacterium]HRY40189.1 serine hydrolase [Candidatus Krumholzibacteria bacterium]
MIKQSQPPVAASLLASLLLIAALPAAAADKAADLDAYLGAAQDVRQFQGAVLVAKDGVPVLAKGYGLASVELAVPNTPQTKFLIGSITKQFTATAILQLQEQGKLSVDDPITKHLPWYPSAPGDVVTIHHLLSHTSGLGNYTEDAALMARRSVEMPIEDLVATFRDRPLLFAPGTQWRYSNSGYVLLGLIIEAASGLSYEDYLEQRIFAPLKLTGSGYAHNETILPQRACGYAVADGALVNAARIAMSLPYSAGAVYSTVGDLFAWVQALHGDAVLTAGSKRQMFTPVLQDYGYGWMMLERAGHRLIFHNGGIDGFTSHLARYPDDGLTIVVLCNNEAVDASGVGFALAAIMFDQPYDRPMRKTPIAADPASFDDYAGVYRLGESQYRVIRREGDALTSQRTGGPVFNLLPEAPDRFFFTHDHAITVTFVRDGQGAVVAQIMHQQGEDTRHDKIAGAVADSLMALQEVSEIDPAISERYVGEYELEPGFTLIFRARDGRLYTQATGQPEFEVFAASETEFFLKVVDARITFDVEGGVVRGLTLRQNGRDLPAPKIR